MRGNRNSPGIGEQAERTDGVNVSNANVAQLRFEDRINRSHGARRNNPTDGLNPMRSNTVIERCSFAAALTLAAAIGSIPAAKAVQTAAQGAACPLHQLASLDLEVLEGGQVLVPVTIHKTAGYMFLEIAGPFSSLSQQAVDRLALKKTEIVEGLDIRTDTNRVRHYATASDFTLGGIAYPQENFPILPDSTGVAANDSKGIIGGLGIDLLWSMDLELDLAHRKLNLYEPGHCAGHVVYWASRYDVVPLLRDAFGDFYFPMELDGKKLEAMLSTESSVTTLSTDVTKRVYGFDKDSPGIESQTDGNGKTIAQYRAMKLTAAGLSVTDEKVRFIDPPHNSCRLARKNDAIGYTNCFYRYPLKLGSDVLKKLHVYIATKENLMYFTGTGDDASH